MLLLPPEERTCTIMDGDEEKKVPFGTICAVMIKCIELHRKNINLLEKIASVSNTEGRAKTSFTDEEKKILADLNLYETYRETFLEYILTITKALIKKSGGKGENELTLVVPVEKKDPCYVELRDILCQEGYVD